MIRRTNTARLFAAALALPLALSACSGSGNDPDGDQVAELDDNLTGEGSDPAMNEALNERILVDPDLADSSNRNTMRAPDRPVDGAVPSEDGYDGDIVTPDELDGLKLMRAPAPRRMAAEDCKSCDANRSQTLGARAEAQANRSGKGTCDARLSYSAGWANRMPPEFPVYPKARVQEAAGVEGGICDIRVVSFVSANSREDIVDYYYTRAKKSGFSAEYVSSGGEYMLGGTRSMDDGAYVITLADRPSGGTSVDIVASNGR